MRAKLNNRPHRNWGICLVAILVFSTTPLFLTASHGSSSVQSDDHAEEETLTAVLEEYLPEMGEKLGVYITVHYLKDPKSFGSSTFEILEAPMDRSVDTIEGLIEEIKRHFKGVQVVIDKHDMSNTVIHLIDDKLGKLKSVLDQKIDFQWSGHPSELAEDLRIRGVPGINPPLAQDLTEGFGGDYETKIQVDAKQQSLRDIFTHNFDLKGRCNLVWYAKTEQDPRSGEWRTWVRFTSPKSQ